MRALTHWSCFFSLFIFASFAFFFFTHRASTELYTLSLHDALPICVDEWWGRLRRPDLCQSLCTSTGRGLGDRKSTRLNSSHTVISYAVFCLKKKKLDHHVVFFLARLERTARAVLHLHGGAEETPHL